MCHILRIYCDCCVSIDRSHQELSAMGKLKNNSKLVCPDKIVPVKNSVEIFG